MKCRTAYLLPLALFLAAGCGDDSGAVSWDSAADPDGDGTSEGVGDSHADTATDPAADTAPDGTGDGVPSACSGCPGTSGCLVVNVGREADDLMQPWVVWPTDADGTGTLVASATGGTGVLDRETLAGADMTPAAALYSIPLCVTPGACEVRVFLDDDEDAPATDTYSSDYLDSCMGQYGDCFRCIDVTAVAGSDTPVDVQLRGSCD